MDCTGQRLGGDQADSLRDGGVPGSRERHTHASTDQLWYLGCIRSVGAGAGRDGSLFWSTNFDFAGTARWGPHALLLHWRPIRLALCRRCRRQPSRGDKNRNLVGVHVKEVIDVLQRKSHKSENCKKLNSQLAPARKNRFLK